MQAPQSDNRSRAILGLMRIESLDDEEILNLFRTARDLGIEVFDHADIYGSHRHTCEARFGAALRLSASDREQIVIQTKTGIRDNFYDLSSEHIVRSVEGSLAALQTDYVDTLLLHRPDTLLEPEEVAVAFDDLHTAGKVRHFGVSNHTPGQVELLARTVRQPLLVDQIQFSVAHASLVAQGLAANIEGLEQAAVRDGGLLDYARVSGMELQAWSPFQHGFLAGPFLGDREHYAELNDVLEELADEHGVTPAAIAVSWITTHPARIGVILGTTKPQRLREAVAGAQLQLTRQEWYRLIAAAGYRIP